jgi:hypothetical protein
MLEVRFFKAAGWLLKKAEDTWNGMIAKETKSFLTKRKDKEDGFVKPPLTPFSTSSQIAGTSSQLWRKLKQTQDNGTVSTRYEVAYFLDQNDVSKCLFS